MTSPLKAAGRAFDPLISATTRALTLPSFGGGSTSSPTVPDIPAPAPAAIQPTSKPAKKGMQQSFLSGVAASALGGQAGSSQGKTLLGA